LTLSGNSAGNTPIIKADGTDSNIGIAIQGKGTGTHSFYTDIGGAAPIQFQVLHTASATRNITITGSNGGNPTISTTAGSLAITPSVVIGGGLQVGTTPASLNAGDVSIPYSGNLISRNNADSGNVKLAVANTQNARTNIAIFGQTASGFLATASKFAAAPTTSDIPDQMFTVWRDTSGAATKLYYNNGGSLQSVALV
jgi:hypothetical protein